MPSSSSCGVYFSYHQELDGDRAEVVMSYSASRGFDVPSIWTQDDWDAANAHGPDFADRKIAEALAGVSVTCLLIGERTVDKPWIRPVLQASHDMGKGIFAVYIHTIPDYDGSFCKKGPNPMGRLKYIGAGNREYPFASYYFAYDWKLHDGSSRFNKWVEIAASQVTESGW